MEEILDTFRDEIIKYLKSLVKSEDYNEKYKMQLWFVSEADPGAGRKAGGGVCRERVGVFGK